MKKVAVVGASVGGLVAAAALRERGHEVTILERSKAIGGLYGKVETPFGQQELGMHVLYAGAEQFRHLNDIFGSDAFQVLEGAAVDIGGNYNFDRLSLNSIYPDVRTHAARNVMLGEICEGGVKGKPDNAMQALTQRFGPYAARNIVAPVLEKLWQTSASDLSAGAIHCFFDLRRIVICDKQEADDLKRDERLDGIIANPEQTRPGGQVFEGRRGLFFRHGAAPFSSKVDEWLERTAIKVPFEQSVSIEGGRLQLNGAPLHEAFDGCIVASPAAALSPAVSAQLDGRELSIVYLKLKKPLGADVPAYYVLGHAPHLLASRFVNYDAYHAIGGAQAQGVMAVEICHRAGEAPDAVAIARECERVFAGAEVEGVHAFPHKLKVAIPSVRNAGLIDSLIAGLEKPFRNEALYWAGMRTDRGIFFSHHTMGAAHDAALDCAIRLS